MTQYLIKFIFYTAGVIGFLLIAYVVAKNSLNGTLPFKKRTGNLEIEETLAISPRKTLHIVKAFNEKFLIASDSNSTTLLAKLNANGEIEQEIQGEIPTEFSTLMGNTEVPKKVETAKKNMSVIQSMLEKLNN